MKQTKSLMMQFGWKVTTVLVTRPLSDLVFQLLLGEKLNYGVQPSKSRTVQVRDDAGMLEAYSEVDKALADLNGNTSEFRLSEDSAFLESMNINFAETLFYGNTEVHPERFMGLAPRYSDLSAENASNIIPGGGSGSDNTSIWLVVWGMEHSPLLLS